MTPMIKEAIILANDFSQQQELNNQEVPTCLFEVNGSPFLVYILDHLIKEGIERVVLSVGYKYELIQNYFGFKYKSLHIKYAVENEPLGTGGAILLAQRYCYQKEFLVLNAHSFFEVNVAQLYDTHRLSNSSLTVAARQMREFERLGTLTFNDKQHITGFHEKQWRDLGFVDSGVYILDHQLLPNLPLPDRFSFEKDVLEAYYRHPAYQFAACPFAEGTPFLDISTLSGYACAPDFFKGFTFTKYTPEPKKQTKGALRRLVGMFMVSLS